MPPRKLDLLPLLDEQALLHACVHADPPIASTHATHIWKAILRAESDQFHPGYQERLQSRLASRAASRAASRNASRRPSIGAASEAAPAAAALTIAEGAEDADEDEKEPAERKEAASPLSECKDDASGVAAMSPRSFSSGSPAPSCDGEHESLAAQFAAEQAARRKLEAEDDARLEGLTVFPHSRYAPTEAELADPTHAVHALRTVTPELVPGLPARLYPLLASRFTFLSSRLQSHKTSADGSTTKLLIRLADGQHIESVIMRHRVQDLNGRPEQRITLCVSSQVGCAMGCTFCATGTMGMRGNLMSGEILEQLLIANRFEKIRNIVFMGMGEPLKNYEAVLSTIRAMSDGARFGLAPSRITLSTVGIVPRMLDLTRDIPSIQLALSLHAPTQELRQQIVPTAKSYPIEKLIEAMDYFILRSKKRILVEYVLLDGVNASEKEAHELGRLLQGKEVMINLIPYNSTAVAANYRAPSREACLAFQSILQQQYSLFTTTRIEMGADIAGACGQLALENQALGGNSAAAAASSSMLKPRGLMDDTATVADDLLPRAAAESAAGAAQRDIEDIGRVAHAKSSIAPIVSKRRRAAPDAMNGSADAAASAACSPSSSPCASSSLAAASASPCCSGDAAAACDCHTDAAASDAASLPAAAAAAVNADADAVDDEDDEQTVADILAREGIAHRPAALATTHKTEHEGDAYLKPQQVAELRCEPERSPAPVKSLYAVAACAVLLALALLHDGGVIRRVWNML